MNFQLESEIFIFSLFAWGLNINLESLKIPNFLDFSSSYNFQREKNEDSFLEQVRTQFEKITFFQGI